MMISQNYSFRVVSVALLVAGFAASCAQAPKKRVSEFEGQDPKDLLAKACQVGQAVRGVKGSVWLKAKSKEASGQFPASVNVTAPETLKMEVTNVLGGTEAVITVQGQRYSVQVPKQKAKSEQGFGSWGGIPLRWSTDLFLGRFPCPSEADRSGMTVAMSPEGDLVVDVPASIRGDAEKFVYHFRKWNNQPWPETLVWERKGGLSVNVSFQFDEPEESTGSPRKWEAQSSYGEVKVKWKDRDVQKAAK